MNIDEWCEDHLNELHKWVDEYKSCAKIDSFDFPLDAQRSEWELWFENRLPWPSCLSSRNEVTQ